MKKINLEDRKRFLIYHIRWEKRYIKELKEDVKRCENEARYKRIWIESRNKKIKGLEEQLKEMNENGKKENN